jgi:4-hydroxy 2-oxovalerate aldolase
MTAAPREVRIADTSLRDGSHAVAHRFTTEQVREMAGALDRAGVPVIEVAHGDGLRGSSFTYGFSLVDELELIAAAAEEVREARIACLLLPGVGTADHLRAAADVGVQIVRVATHCTEADVAIEHFGIARELGLETVGFLMLSHMLEPEPLAEQARVMADAGAQCVYVVDSAGALILSGAAERVAALVAEVGNQVEVGFHAHNNLGVAVANSLVALEAGATQLDGSVCGLGAGAGNAATELLVAVLDRSGYATGIDLIGVLAAAEETVRPMLGRLPVPDRNSIMLGYAGVYSSFLLHAEQAGERYGVPPHEILLEAGRRRYVGGQEDMLIDVALSLAEAGATLGGDRE